MKRYFYTLCFLFISLTSTFAQNARIEWQNPRPTGIIYNDVAFLDSLQAVVVGNYGSIVRTQNGGNTWSVQEHESYQHIRSVKFFSKNYGFAAGDSGILLRTYDGGQSWERRSLGRQNNLRSIYFLDSLNVFTCGNRGGLFRSSNGGQSWQYIVVSIQFNLTDIHFLDQNNGLVSTSNGRIFKTTDGGANWEFRTTGISTELTTLLHLGGQTFLTSSITGSTFRSTDGGTNWSTSGVISFSNKKMIRASNNTLWAVGSTSNISRSTNNGTSWTATNLQYANLSGLNSIGATPTNNLIVVGEAGTLGIGTQARTDFGNLRKGTLNNFVDADFSNEYEGWAVGGQGTVYHTTNSGLSWDQTLIGSGENMVSVSFANQRKGIVIGGGSVIHRTTNGGSNWVSTSTPNQGLNRKVHFADSSNAFLLTNTRFYKSSNGGSSWVSTPTTFSSSNTMFFLNNQFGWASVINGTQTLLKTSNGGTTWEPTGSFRANDIHFINPLVGLVGTSNGIGLTINGGSTWEFTNLNTPINVVRFLQNGVGVALGSNGNIYYSNNNGQTWNIVRRNNYFLHNKLNDLEIVNSNSAWAVGDRGTIVRLYFAPAFNLPQSLVAGITFRKISPSCELFANPFPLPNRVLKATPGPFYSYSGNMGIYYLLLPNLDSSVSYQITGIPNNATQSNEQLICPPGNFHEVTIGTSPDTIIGKNFGFELPTCHRLTIQQSQFLRRACNTTNTNVSFSNLGSQPALNAYIIARYPRWIRPVSATIPYTNINDSTIQFNVGTIPVERTGYFRITEQVVACNNPSVTGLSQCLTLEIYPTSNCPTSNWNGSAVSIRGKCLENQTVSLGIYNRTSSNMSDSVDYVVYLDSILVASKKVKLAAGDSLKLLVNTFGYAVHFAINQVSRHPTESSLNLTLNNCNSSFRTSVSLTLPLNFPPSDNIQSSTVCQILLNGYDPNDKLVTPIGFTSNGIVPPNTRLNYTVRFQNTGNDTAFNVVIIDSLDFNLDPESFILGPASHPNEFFMQTTMAGKTYLIWVFRNILLPDSGINEPASNGLVSFSIKPKPGIPLGSEARNDAGIYFDFNSPVITNQTLTTFDLIQYRDSTLVGVVREVTTGANIAAAIHCKLYPNPLNAQELTIETSEPSWLSIVDLMGKEIVQEKLLKGKNHIQQQLLKGLYVVKIHSEAGLWREKLVVE